MQLSVYGGVPLPPSPLPHPPPPPPSPLPPLFHSISSNLEPLFLDTCSQGCGSGSTWICINFSSGIRIRIQYADTDPEEREDKMKKFRNKIVIFL